MMKKKVTIMNNQNHALMNGVVNINTRRPNKMGERPTRRGRVSEEVETEERIELRKPGRFANEPVEPEFDYDADLHIDPNFLDAEFLGHSEVFMKYAKESARTKKVASFAEEKVKTVRSQVVNRLKTSGEKHTESSIEAAYRLDPDYIKAKEDWLEAVFDADLMVNAVFAFQSRKTALENLVRLQGAGYYSAPTEPRDLPEAAKRLHDLKEGRTEESIKSRMNKR
jgi:hypothetical protein